MVVPDNVLFEDNTGKRLRQWAMELTSLHTILRLPTGIFYAQGVKTNVLFLQKGVSERANTKTIWVYDMRANMPAFGKTRPLTVTDFAAFEASYGDDPNGGSARADEGPSGRFRAFTREVVAERGDNLDLSWLKDDSDAADDDLTDPEDIAAAILAHLRAALVEVEAVEPRSWRWTTFIAERSGRERTARRGWARPQPRRCRGRHGADNLRHSTNLGHTSRTACRMFVRLKL